MTTKLVGHTAGAVLLLWAGRGDWRTWLLGVYSLLKATQAPLLMLPAFVLELPPPPEYAAYLQHLPADSRLFTALYVPAFLFAPAFLWAFARECPRVHRRTRLDDLARRMVPASVLIGGGLWLACAVTLVLARAGVAAAPVALVIDGTIATLDLLALGAVTLVALRAHTASAEEVRRVVVFSAGFLLFMGVSSVYNVAEVFAPGDWVSNYRWSPTILLMEALRFPGLILLWYAVLAARIPHLREAVRELYRRLLLRRGLLGAVAAVPAGALAWLIGRSPERAVGAVIADPLAQSLFAAVGILLLVIAARERILIRLDAWILPETADQRQALADAAGALARAGRITTVGETVTRTVRRGCGSPATLLVADDAETRAGGFSAPQARIVPLSRQTAIVHLLETAGGPVRVEPDGRPSVFPLLPPDEAAWVTETGADVIVPAPGPGTDVLGVLVVGRRLDGRLVRSLDLPFLEALGAAAGLALARLQLLDAPGAGLGEAQTLPDGIFDSLLLLKELTLHENRFTSLPDGLFEELSLFDGMQADGSQPDNSGPYPRIQRFLDRHAVSSPEEFIAALPTSYLQRFVLMYRSESPAAPRLREQADPPSTADRLPPRRGDRPSSKTYFAAGRRVSHASAACGAGSSAPPGRWSRSPARSPCPPRPRPRTLLGSLTCQSRLSFGCPLRSWFIPKLIPDLAIAPSQLRLVEWPSASALE